MKIKLERHVRVFPFVVKHGIIKGIQIRMIRRNQFEEKNLS